jgi:hypothetical protein
LRELVKSTVVGALSGACSWFATVTAVGSLSALGVRDGTSPPAWEPVAVFGLGAALVALVIHLVALRLSNVRTIAAFFAFAAVVVGLVAATGPIASGLRFIGSVIVGAAAASLLARLRPNPSFKPTPSARLNSRR